jgi:hypothetical protein
VVRGGMESMEHKSSTYFFFMHIKKKNWLSGESDCVNGAKTY